MTPTQRLLPLLLILLLTACSTPAALTPVKATAHPTDIPASPTALPTVTPTEQSPPTPPNTPIIPLPPTPLTFLAADVPALIGVAPPRLAAFRWHQNAWEQLPVQVDEQALLDLSDVNGRSDTDAPVFTFYADPVLRPDPDPLLDADDEIVLLGDRLGAVAAPLTRPPGTLAAGATVVRLTDPLNPAAIGVVYLFAHDGTLDPTAGNAAIDYTYHPLANAPKDKDDVGAGVESPVEEDSWVTTAVYRHHFSAPWILDELYLLEGADPAANLIDRFRIQLQPGDCDRSEDTFSAGRNYFVVNKTGPIRALRSVIGANSGVYTQRLHRFYEGHQEIVTFVRVHALPGLTFFIDYAPAAIGMRYYNDANPAGVVVDGIPDAIDDSPPDWELLTGSPGSILITTQAQSDLPNLNVAAYYLDDTNPEPPPCTGDDAAIGQSGHVFFPIACTDPARAAVDPNNCPTAHTFILNQQIFYSGDQMTPEAGPALIRRSRSPLNITIASATP